MPIALLDKEKIATEPGFITVYSYSATGEYTGSNEEYLAIGVGLPAFSTDVPPPIYQAGFASVFVGTEWKQQEDHRGALVYSTTDGTPSIVDYIGDIKAGSVADKPTTPYDVWGDSGWITDNQKLKVAQVAAAEQEKARLLSIAASQISILQDATDPDVMGDNILPGDISLLKLWRQYRVLLNRIDTSKFPNITWPEKPSELIS